MQRLATVSLDRLLPVLLSGLLLCACSMRPTPLSVQAGSTVAVPLDGSSRIGYASALVEDLQRGGPVFALDAPAESGGLVLETRLVTSLIAPDAARGGIAPPKRALVALVDVPATTPPGTHALHVSHAGGTQPGLLVGLPPLELKVLPASVTAGTSTVVGTPFAFDAVWSVDPALPIRSDVTPLFAQSVPRPSVELHLSTSVWAAELDLTYPNARIALVDAVAWRPYALLSENRPQAAWLRRTGPGRAEVSAVGREASFRVLSLVFELEGDPPFEPEQACDPDCAVPCDGLRICAASFRNAAGRPIAVDYTLEVR